MVRLKLPNPEGVDVTALISRLAWGRLWFSGRSGLARRDASLSATARCLRRTCSGSTRWGSLLSRLLALVLEALMVQVESKMSECGITVNGDWAIYS